MCPQCGGRVLIEPYDFGRCTETGYQDAGERFHCTECGAQGEADEIVYVEDEAELCDVPG